MWREPEKVEAAMRGLWGEVEREREETREESEREDWRLRDGGVDLGRE